MLRNSDRSAAASAYCRTVFAITVFGCTGATPAAPPTIIAVEPPPSEWIVNEQPLSQLTLTFDQEVDLPSDAVIARTLGGGSLPVSLDSLPGVPTTAVVISIPAISADRLTLVVDFSIINMDGVALDGEVQAPHDPTFPTGDGRQGGAAVFQFTVLQGDVNRDGVVDILDHTALGAVLGTCEGEPDYDPHADLDASGCVDDADAAILISAFGTRVPSTDGAPPTVALIAPTSLPLPEDQLVVTFDELIDPETIARTTVYGVNSNGALIVPTDPPTTVDGRTFVFPMETQPACQEHYELAISNAVADQSGLLLDQTFLFELDGADQDPPALACPQALYVNSTTLFGIPQDEVPTLPQAAGLLDDIVASDACSPVNVATSLDTATEDLPLGVSTIEVTATDAAGNASTCDVTLIVVPAVIAPACWDLNGNGHTDPEEDGNGDGLFDALDCQGATGAEGPTGPPGAAGENGAAGSSGGPGPPGQNGLEGMPGPAGSQGNTGLAGEDGTDGERGTAGAPGPAGPAGPQGEAIEVTVDSRDQDTAGQNIPEEEVTPTPPERGLCGALGMINAFLMATGLCLVRRTLL